MSSSAATTIREFLRTKFPRGPQANSHYGKLLVDYWKSGIAPPHFVKEVTCGDDGKFWSYTWEAILYCHLQSLNLEFKPGRVRKSGQAGPDFGVVCGSKTVWIEAVAPAPEGIPADFLRSPELGEPARVRTTPHEAVQLRWLTALSDKEKKLADYIDRQIIGANDCTVIAVNGCRLSDWWINDNGISQLPMILEAVFPIGPLAIPIANGKLDGDIVRIPRHSIQKPSNSAGVPTTMFLNPQYAHVSAVIGCIRRDMLASPILPLTLVHNPLATNSLPRRMLGVTREFVADEHGEQYLVHPLD